MDAFEWDQDMYHTLLFLTPIPEGDQAQTQSLQRSSLQSDYNSQPQAIDNITGYTFIGWGERSSDRVGLMLLCQTKARILDDKGIPGKDVLCNMRE